MTEGVTESEPTRVPCRAGDATRSSSGARRLPFDGRRLQPPVQVAVVAVRMVKRAAHLEVRVASVRNRGGRVVAAVAFHGGAHARAPAVHLQPVLVRVRAVRRVQVAVVEVVGVVAMANPAVAAPGPVLVLVAVVGGAAHARIVPPAGAAVNLSESVRCGESGLSSPRARSSSPP